MRTILMLAALLVGCAPALSAAERAPDPDRWRSVLHMLDERRERAYVRGDPSLLDGVYVAGSAVRRRDARLIRAYERRRLELDAVPLRISAVDVLTHDAARVRLRVVDRLGTVRVRHAGGAWRTLPTDRPTERIITLTRKADDWRIAATRRVAG